VSLNPQESSTDATVAKFLVEVSESTHLVERFTLVFPIVKTVNR
jgi:hypothetical protein